MYLHEAVEWYCDHHICVRYKNWRQPVNLVRRYLLDLPNVPLEHLTRGQAIEWRNQIGQKKPAAANAAAGHLCTLYRVMIEGEYYDERNPAQYLKALHRPKRRTVLQDSKIPAVLSILMEESLKVRLYLLTVMITGARRNEVRMMRWMDLELETGIWTLPPTKNGDVHRLHLPDDLLTYYRHMAGEHPQQEAYVFSLHGDLPWGFTTVRRYWVRVRERAGCAQVTIHDLRRTLISYFCDQGEKEVAMRIANHRSVKTTERYHVWGNAPQVTRALAAYARRIMGSPSNEGVSPEAGQA